MKKPEGPGAALIIFIVIVALGFGVCVATCDDDDDDALPALVVSRHRDRDGGGCRQDCRRSGDGDRKGNRYCFMPCDFTIIVPVPTPGGGPEEQASLMPPDPAKLIEAIRVMTAGVGEASGALAGAIAGGTIGILL